MKEDVFAKKEKLYFFYDCLFFLSNLFFLHVKIVLSLSFLHEVIEALYVYNDVIGIIDFLARSLYIGDR